MLLNGYSYIIFMMLYYLAISELLSRTNDKLNGFNWLRFNRVDRLKTKRAVH